MSSERCCLPAGAAQAVARAAAAAAAAQVAARRARAPAGERAAGEGQPLQAPISTAITAPGPTRADQVPGELLPPAGQPRVRVHQSHLRVLRRVQAEVQHPALADLHGLLQLPARLGAHRREGACRSQVALAQLLPDATRPPAPIDSRDTPRPAPTRGLADPVHARRALARAQVARADQAHRAADGRAGLGPLVRLALGRPRQGHPGLGRERPRRQLHLWARLRHRVPAETRPRPRVPGAPGARKPLPAYTTCPTPNRHNSAAAESSTRRCWQR